MYLLFEREEPSFYDFLKAMENDRAGFLEGILSVLLMKKTRKNVDAKKVLEEFNSLLFEFIDKKILVDSHKHEIHIEKIEQNGIARKLPLEEALTEFSPGELMLFYLCVFLVIISRNYPDGVVLILDEPELHLHPRALVKMIRTLKESTNVAELWIASHSLFLVPLFEFEEIVFLDQNTVYSRNSQIYKNLYDSLVGLENINLFEFLKSLDNWQYYQFIVECFCLPKAVGKANVKDEQFCKLLNAIRNNLDHNPLQLLDYGAGKCRIWECMQLLPDSSPEKNQVVYSAYEPYPEDGLKGNFPIYTDFSDIRKKQKRFQVVVLMNVLHEIEATKWLEAFQNIYSIMSNDGMLVFLEVLSLTKGEQPYGNTGYLVLQDEQVKILFNDSNIINLRVNPKEKSNCWVLTKTQVGNVSSDTIRKSIYDLKTSSLRELRAAFEHRIAYAHGSADDQQKQQAARRYAFLSQQYINALLSSYNNKERSGHLKDEAIIDPINSDTESIRVTGIKEEYL